MARSNIIKHNNFTQTVHNAVSRKPLSITLAECRQLFNKRCYVTGYFIYEHTDPEHISNHFMVHIEFEKVHKSLFQSEIWSISP